MGDDNVAPTITRCICAPADAGVVENTTKRADPVNPFGSAESGIEIAVIGVLRRGETVPHERGNGVRAPLQ